MKILNLIEVKGHDVMKKNTWDAKKYGKHAEFVPKLAFPLIELLSEIKGKKSLMLDVEMGH